MQVPALTRRIVLPHCWPALDQPHGADGLELWSLTTDAAEGWRTPAEAWRWLRDPEAAVAGGVPPDHLRRWEALSARRPMPAIAGLDGHAPGHRRAALAALQPDPPALATRRAAAGSARRRPACFGTVLPPRAGAKKSTSSSFTRSASSWWTQWDALGRRSTRSRLGTSSWWGSASLRAEVAIALSPDDQGGRRDGADLLLRPQSHRGAVVVDHRLRRPWLGPRLDVAIELLAPCTAGGRRAGSA